MIRGRPHLPVRGPQLPRPLAGLLRALGLPVVEIARYWALQARSIRTGSAALGIGLMATLVAGTVLVAGRGQLARYPGLIVLIPAAIGMRGSIFGALAARLGTGIMTGQLAFELRRDSFLGQQIEAAGLLSVSTAVEAGMLAWAMARLLGRQPVGMLDLVAVSITAGLVASAALLGVTLWVARVAERRGWSMDDVGTPVITATGDLITLPALLLAAQLLRVESAATVVGGGALVAAGVALTLGWRHDQPTVRRVVRESLVVLTVAVTLQVLAGVVLASRQEALVERLPALLGLVPPFIATCGSLGGMLASRLASQLHLGLLEPATWPGRTTALDFSVTFLLATVAFTGVGGIGWLGALVVGAQLPSLLSMVAVALLGGLFATLALSAVAYGAATASFYFGFDPDNHGIPIVTAVMDFLGILALISAVALLQVG